MHEEASRKSWDHQTCRRYSNSNGKDIIPESNAFLKNFLDLLKKIFVYNPAERITAKAALQHPWFKEPAHPDDGTEAAKIRLERMREGEFRSAMHQ
jgi:dual-specificity kinase